MGVDCSTSNRGVVRAPPSLTVEKVRHWSQEADAALSECFGESRDAIVRGVLSGRMELHRLNGGRAWMVTSVADGVLTVHCFQGAGLREISPVLYQVARDNKLHAIEFWTRRPALARMLAVYGFTPRETAYRCEVQSHVQ